MILAIFLLLLQVINFAFLIYLKSDYLICGMYIAYFLVKLPVPIGTLLLM